jgi:zinc protease
VVVCIPLVEDVTKGVRVVALSRKFLRSASIVLLIGRGSYSDPVEGCACLANRMRLRLTSRLEPFELQAAIDRLGATVDATTDRDFTLVRAQAPSKRVEECLKFAAELFTSSSFPETEVAKEKASQKLEYEKTMQDPMTAATADVWEATFPASPLGHPATGYPETIEKLTPKILEEFDAETRAKSSLVVGIVGPQDENELVSLARSAFGETEISPRVETLNTGSRKELRVLRRFLEVKQTTYSLGFATSGVSSPEYPALLLLEDYLGSDRHYTGVLFRELREKRGLTYFAQSRLSAFRDCGLLMAFAGAEHRMVTEALGLMLGSIAELRDETIEEKELEQLKVFHRQVMGITLEVPFQAATWLASTTFRGGKVDFESYIADVNAVTPEAMTNTARKLLVPSNVALSVAGSPPEESSLVKIMKERLE